MIVLKYLLLGLKAVTSIDIKRRLTREAEHKISGVALITCVYIKVLHALFSGLFIRFSLPYGSRRVEGMFLIITVIITSRLKLLLQNHREAES